jgi:orotate phosphoribosyltransferase
VTNDEALALFRDAGALLTGHFELSSGRHSGEYLEKFRLVENPRLLEPMCRDLAERFAGAGARYVLGPTTAGIILAYRVADYLHIEGRYAEKEGGERKLRRGQSLPEGSKVLVVDDILTTGGAVRECTDLVARHGAELVGVGVLGDRSGGKVRFDAPLEAVLTVDVVSYAPEDCPLCRAGVPIDHPGTSAIRTR